MCRISSDSPMFWPKSACVSVRQLSIETRKKGGEAKKARGATSKIVISIVTKLRRGHNQNPRQCAFFLETGSKSTMLHYRLLANRTGENGGIKK